ncbi:hypothetical protein D3C81_1882610 [compost metagenome]
MQLANSHQHAGMATSQKFLQTRALADKGREQQAHQLRFAQTQVLLEFGVGLDAPLGQCRGIVVKRRGLLANGLW